MKKKLITIDVERFYGTAWINVVRGDEGHYILNKLYRTKQDAKDHYPAMVKSECRKVVKVCLVEAL